MGVSTRDITQVEGNAAPAVVNYLQNKKRKELARLESRYGVEIFLQGDPLLAPGSEKLVFFNENGDEKSISAEASALC